MKNSLVVRAIILSHESYQNNNIKLIISTLINKSHSKNMVFLIKLLITEEFIKKKHMNYNASQSNHNTTTNSRYEISSLIYRITVS